MQQRVSCFLFLASALSMFASLARAADRPEILIADFESSDYGQLSSAKFHRLKSIHP